MCNIMGDLKTQVFNAISNGDLNALTKILAPLSSTERNSVISSKNNDDATPLLVASRAGHCHILEYLITECQADVEQVGKVEFDGEKIDRAPPLWCSAAVGCLKCVQTLVNHGAKVNSTTSTNSTPLRAASFDGHLPIVKFLVDNGADIEIANQHGHTCLMIACYKKHYAIAQYLIDQGAQINRQSVKGNTAMHDCSESSSLDIMKLLVRNGAVLLHDSFGLTAVMTAALAGNKEMVDYLKSVFKCSIEDEVDAYKLLGATAVDKFYDISSALEFWRRALRLSVKCSPEYHKSLHNTDEYYREAYGNAQECKTEEDLNELYCDPEQMKMQSLIIRERILGINHPETFYFIRYRGAAYADSGDFNRCVSLWMYNLERQQKAYKPCSDMTQSSFGSIIELFSFMFQKCDSSIRICDIFRVLKLAISELLSTSSVSRIRHDKRSRVLHHILERKLVCRKDSKTFHGHLGLDKHFLIVIQLIGFMCQLRPRMLDNEWQNFKKSIYEFVSLEPRTSGSYPLLHVLSLLSQNEKVSTVNIPMQEVFQLVVDVSPNLNTIDVYGNTALHHLFNITVPVKWSLVQYLVDKGAHIDCANEDGMIPLDYAANANALKARFLSLQCMCASLIVKKKLPLDKLSQQTREFVFMHQPKGYSSNIYQS